MIFFKNIARSVSEHETWKTHRGKLKSEPEIQVKTKKSLLV